MPDLQNTVINGILCYIASARDTLSHDEIVSNAFAFYKAETVVEAKEIICGLTKEKFVNRKSCNAHKDPAEAHLKDILECFAKMERNNDALPRFVADSFLAFPPIGFKYLAPTLCSMRDEVAALREEVVEVRRSNERDARALNSNNVISQEISEIKTLVQRIVQINHGNLSPNEVSASSGNQSTSGAQIVAEDGSTPTSTEVESGPHIDEENSSGGDDNWQLVNRSRPYANALKKKFNPIQHNSTSQKSRNNTSAPRPPRQRREVITGRRTSNGDFGNSEQIVDIFLGGCKTSTTNEVIETYCSNNGVILKKCESLNSRNEWLKCFKLSILLADRDRILDGDFWPCGVYVRKFFNYGSKPRNVD